MFERKKCGKKIENKNCTSRKSDICMRTLQLIYSYLQLSMISHYQIAKWAQRAYTRTRKPWCGETGWSNKQQKHKTYPGAAWKRVYWWLFGVHFVRLLFETLYLHMPKRTQFIFVGNVNKKQRDQQKKTKPNVLYAIFNWICLRTKKFPCVLIFFLEFLVAVCETFCLMSSFGIFRMTNSPRMLNAVGRFTRIRCCIYVCFQQYFCYRLVFLGAREQNCFDWNWLYVEYSFKALPLKWLFFFV